VGEAQEQVRQDTAGAGLIDDDVPLAEGGTGARAYGEAIGSCLGLAVDRMADRHSTLTRWDPNPSGYAPKIANTFSRQALPMVWDFTEGNPFSSSSGNLEDALGWIIKVLEFLHPGSAGEVLQHDITQSVGLFHAVVSTDPPYYDNIGYADLSDFFYVWLRRSLRGVYPELFSTLLAPKAQELVATPYRFGGSRQKAEAYFREGLGQAFAAIRRAQAGDYPMTVFYAFKQAESDAGASASDGAASTGWETMLSGLIDARFSVTGTWPMRSELANRMVASGTNALASSIVLVCRPRAEDAPTASRAEFLEDLGLAMRAALPLLASGQVAPVDLAQASIGPGMAAYSKYRAVIRQDGRKVTVREALQDINTAIASYRSERVSSFDPDTRFCVDWYDQHGYGDGPYGDADSLARTYNVAPEALRRAGLLTMGQGRLRLEQPAAYPVGVADLAERSFGGSAWEACLRLALTLRREGDVGAAALARELGEGAAARARELAVWLYTIADTKRRSDDALLFNDLDASWSGIQEQLARQSAGRQMGL
jgi:putative DNA methylase